MPNGTPFSGTWNCIWENGTSEQLTVDASNSFQCYGSTYLLNINNEGIVTFNWSDNTLQTLTEDRINGNVRTLQWTTTHADYATIRWEMQLQQ